MAVRQLRQIDPERHHDLIASIGIQFSQDARDPNAIVAGGRIETAVPALPIAQRPILMPLPSTFQSS